MSPSRVPLSFALLSMLTLAGCRVDTHKDGKNADVNIGTPFGSMHVKTDEKGTTTQTGLTLYPGATLVHKNDHDDGAADINMSFGSFKFGVHALDLQTADSQDKVLAFYKKDMARYGDVLTCRGKEPVGTPVRTSEGLTCSSQQHSTDEGVELRTGSEQHQHIVGIREEDGATRIGLVAFDIPKSTSNHESSDRE